MRFVREHERRIDSWHGGGPRSSRRDDSHRPRYRSPARSDVVTRLDAAGLLPAITFVFSRNGCDAAVHQCLLAGLRLTDEAERAEIAEIIDRRTGSLPEEDLHVLGFWEWREGLLAGLAAHHAGLVPAFKETVEECFVRGLVKAVFATETLALGINMPARSVVLERLVKWNGEAHVDVTPGEYTQLTGRAGRRGIDVEGHAVVVWAPGRRPRRRRRAGQHPHVPAEVVVPAELQHGGQPGQLLRPGAGPRAARLLLRPVPGRPVGRRAGPGRGPARAGRRAVRRGDALRPRGRRRSTRELRRQIGDREKELSRDSQAKRRIEAAEALAALRPGDVIRVPSGRRQGLAVVLDPGITDLADPRPLVLTEDKWAGRLGPIDFPTPVSALARVRVPKNFNHRSPHARRDLASTLRNARVENDLGARRGQAPLGRRRRPGARRPAPRAARPPGARAARPRGAGPGRRALAARGAGGRRAAAQDGRADRLAHPAVRRAPATSSRSWATWCPRSRRWCRPTPRSLGAADDVPVVTDDGRRLARIWSEADLLVAECLRAGAWRGLTPAELAAVGVHGWSSRRAGTTRRCPPCPAGKVAAAIGEMRRIRAPAARRRGRPRRAG